MVSMAWGRVITVECRVKEETKLTFVSLFETLMLLLEVVKSFGLLSEVRHFHLHLLDFTS